MNMLIRMAFMGGSRPPWVKPIKLDNPGVLPTGDGQNVSFSPSGQFMAVGHSSPPYGSIYNVFDGFVKVPDFLTYPGVPTPNRAVFAFSPDGHDMVVFIGGGAYVYKYPGGVFSSPTTIDAAAQRVSASFSDDSEYLLASGSFAPTLAFYYRSGGTYALGSAPALSTITNAAMSPNGLLAAATSTATNRGSYIYQRSGTSLSLVVSNLLPNGANRCARFSPDGQLLLVGYDNSPYLHAYSISGTSFTEIPGFIDPPTGRVNGIAFSKDGNFLALAHNNSPYVTLYAKDGGSFIKLPPPDDLPAGTGQGVAFSPSGFNLGVAHSNSPYITIYRAS